jgi:hypothetical protein
MAAKKKNNNHRCSQIFLFDVKFIIHTKMEQKKKSLQFNNKKKN